jgi:hypothetical protein
MTLRTIRIQSIGWQGANGAGVVSGVSEAHDTDHGKNRLQVDYSRGISTNPAIASRMTRERRKMNFL